MFKKIKYILLTTLLVISTTQPASAGSFNNDDMAFAFSNSPSVSSELDEFALLSNKEMEETEGEFWPVFYGVAWGLSRAAIWGAGRYGSRWGFRAITSSKNHRLLLRNGNHVLQTGGSRGVSGFGQNASHIGWGRSSRGNFSNRHLFLNNGWRIR